MRVEKTTERPRGIKGIKTFRKKERPRKKGERERVKERERRMGERERQTDRQRAAV